MDNAQKLAIFLVLLVCGYFFYQCNGGKTSSKNDTIAGKWKDLSNERAGLIFEFHEIKDNPDLITSTPADWEIVLNGDTYNTKKPTHFAYFNSKVDGKRMIELYYFDFQHGIYVSRSYGSEAALWLIEQGEFSLEDKKLTLNYNGYILNMNNFSDKRPFESIEVFEKIDN